MECAKIKFLQEKCTFAPCMPYDIKQSKCVTKQKPGDSTHEVDVVKTERDNNSHCL